MCGGVCMMCMYRGGVRGRYVYRGVCVSCMCGAYIYVCVCVCVYVYIYVCVCVCLYIYIYIYMGVYLWSVCIVWHV